MVRVFRSVLFHLLHWRLLLICLVVGALRRDVQSRRRLAKRVCCGVPFSFRGEPKQEMLPLCTPEVPYVNTPLPSHGHFRARRCI